jgi:hypothetical protein
MRSTTRVYRYSWVAIVAIIRSVIELQYWKLLILISPTTVSALSSNFIRIKHQFDLSAQRNHNDGIFASTFIKSTTKSSSDTTTSTSKDYSVNSKLLDRRNYCQSIMTHLVCTSYTVSTLAVPKSVAMEDDTMSSSSNLPRSSPILENNMVTSVTMPMKTFVDPEGIFSIDVPTNFFTLRRTVKGDLPDSKTSNGRRGSSIFSAGDMAKAEIVAIER